MIAVAVVRTATRKKAETLGEFDYVRIYVS